MKKVWSISTTLRNPERLRNFLVTLKEMEGKVWDKEAQLEFQIRLIKNRFYGFSNTQFYKGLSQEHIDLIEDISKPITMEQAGSIFTEKQYVDASMRGRNSYKTLEKMGLVCIVEKKISITSLGSYLLGDDYDLGELFFKSFIKWQYPNPVDRAFSDASLYNLKPFILTLHLIHRVNLLCQTRGLKVKGVSKLEFEIFVQTLIHYKELERQAERLLDFRMALEKLKDHQQKRAFVESYKRDFLAAFSNIENLKDYADNTIRYFRLTRFLYIRGGGYYIDLEPRRRVEIDALLQKYDGSIELFTKASYIEYISDIKQPVLPWEEREKLEAIYVDILEEVHTLEKFLHLSATPEKTHEDTQSLKTDIEGLRAYRKHLQNQKLRVELQDISKVDEVIYALEHIRELELKPSIALEKYVSRALHIINDAQEIRANALVGDDNAFIFTAPANKPDIECYYRSFNAICEVTMLTGRDQWHNEGQPVMRHFRDFEKSSSSAHNYCIFVAPKMHRDTINTFWFALKYEYEGQQQKIIPLNITQIIELLTFIKQYKQKDRKFLHTQFQNLLEMIVDLKEQVSTSDEWLRGIPATIETFKKGLDV